jgi:monoamine oxidase
MMRSRADHEILIVGAGAAGLAAAAEIARRGGSALVLEARDRIGGRCRSRHIPGVPVPIELGAEFIHGRADAIRSLLARTAGVVVDAPRRPWILKNGKLVPRADFLSQVQAAMAASRLARRDVSFDDYLERELRPRLSQDACTFARMLVQGYDAADPARVSARSIVEEWTREASGNDLARPLGGYGALLDRLYASLAGAPVAIRLQTAVRAVSWKRGAVHIDALSGGRIVRFSARRAIVTLPLGVLQCRARKPGAVCFDPPLKRKETALRSLGAGAVIKVVLQFRTAFWESLENGRYSDASFFHAPELPFPTLWTPLPMRAPLLVAWAGGPHAVRMAGMSDARLVQCALDSVNRLFGHRHPEARPVAAYVHDWQSDPFARGAYSSVLVGGLRARRTLAASVESTLYFAGEATDSEGEAGTVAGALQSGERAAREAWASRS